MKIRLGILGATGMIGREMLTVLEQTAIELSELRLFASTDAHAPLFFRDKPVPIRKAEANSFRGLTHVLSAVSAEQIQDYLPFIKAANAILIDNSSAFRQRDDVPLIIPEINGNDLLSHQGIISNPNCSTIIALIAIHALHQKYQIESMSVSTYQAVSGAGKAAVAELYAQYQQIHLKEKLQASVFAYPIVNNLLPCIGEMRADGYTTEEYKMQAEGRKILHDPKLLVSCSCVRVPIERCHSLAMEISFQQEIQLEEIENILRHTSGVMLCEESAASPYPMPYHAGKQPAVLVGRLRQSVIDPAHRLTLFCVGDQLLRGAAYNAVMILVELIKRTDALSVSSNQCQ